MPDKYADFIAAVQEEPKPEQPVPVPTPKESLGSILGKALGKAQDVGREALSSILPPEIMQPLFGGSESGMRETDKAPALISPEHAREFIGQLPSFLGGDTEFAKGVAEKVSQNLSEFSKPGALAQLPAFLAPGVAETYTANVLAGLPEQAKQVKETIQKHGLFSNEAGQALAQAGITDLTALVAGKEGTAGRAISLERALKPTANVPVEQLSPEQIAEATVPKEIGGETNAVTERPVEQGGVQQREQTVEGGVSAEAGGGDRTPEGGQSAEAVTQAPVHERLAAAQQEMRAAQSSGDQARISKATQSINDLASEMMAPAEAAKEKARAEVVANPEINPNREVTNSTVFHPEDTEMAQKAAESLGLKYDGTFEDQGEQRIQVTDTRPGRHDTYWIEPGETVTDLKTRIANKDILYEAGPAKTMRGEAMRQAELHEPAGAPSAQLGITPGASPFVKEDVAKIVSGGLTNAVKGFKQLRNILAPAAAGPEALKTAGIVRENAAELARKHEIASTQLEGASDLFKKTSNQFNLDVIDKIETGTKQATPELDQFSNEIRKQLDDRVKQVQAINPNALQNLIQDYFPHIWTPESIAEYQQNPNAPTGNVWAAVFGKRPLEGPKSFLKQRTIPTTIDGVGLGLVPVSWNPVDLQLLKLHEMDRYIMGQKIMGEMKDQGLAKFVPSGARPEPGYVQINDKIARVFAPKNWKIVDEAGKEVPGQKLLGHYYAPEDAARVINNYLSPGLRGNVAFNAFRWLGNIQNQVQLGISLYHATFTSLDAATSAFALGLEKIARSGGSPKEIAAGALDVAKGLGEAVTGVGGLIENIWRGNRFLREYSRPGTTNADLAHIVDTAVKGGARIKMDTFYNTGAVKSFFDAIKSENYTGAVLRAPFAAIEAAAKPLMQYAVPRMKAGVISQMLEYELSKLPKNATQDDIRVIAGRVVDSVDNRMGQMIYDNLFWNKVLKDGLMASVRSVGWNLGDIREIGGGALDTLMTPARAYKAFKGNKVISDNPVVTHRMAYLAGLPLVVGILGSMYQYLATGQGPQSLQDAYMPKTGRKKPDGTDERVMLPTYMKDIAPLAVAGQRGMIPLINRAVSMGQNKLHPTLTMLSQMFHNQDYYGNQIRNEDDGLVQTLKKEAEFAVKQWRPFSVQGVVQREGGLPEKLQAVAGIMPAPGELTRTPAMQMIHEINLSKRPAGGYTAAQQQKREDKFAAEKGKDLRLDLFKRLSLEERQRVLEVSTPEEKSIFGQVKTRQRKRKFTIVK